jgi:hypothetical protein
VNCTVVRDALPEFALGVAGGRETTAIELHVETCAACRKEAIDLQRAAAAFGYAVAPSAEPAPELVDRVVGAVHDVARPSRLRPHLHSRRAGVVLLAAAILVAGIGVGSVYAGRKEFQRLEAARVQTQQTNALGSFGVAARELDPGAKILIGALEAPHGRGTGSALTIVSPAVEDRLVVMVSDLRDPPLPLTVSISDTKGGLFELGSIKRLDATGGATFARIAHGSLQGFIVVTIRDAKGHLVLRGTLEPQTAVASPSP